MLITICVGDNPFILDKFKSVLSKSKLQAPTSKDAHYDLGRYVPPQYLNLPPGQSAMDFMITRTGSEGRSELRQLMNWFTSDSTEHRMDAVVRFFRPATTEMTFMQILGDGRAGPGPSKPLVRLAWYARRKMTSCSVSGGKIVENDSSIEVEDWIFAVIREEGGRNSCQHPFMKRPDGFFSASIAARSNHLTIAVGGKSVSYPIPYWGSYQSYFKAGTYLQSTGYGKVSFSSLHFSP